MLVNVFLFQRHEVSIATRGRSCVLMLSKCGKVRVGEGEAGEKAKTTPDAGGKSVSQKSQSVCD